MDKEKPSFGEELRRLREQKEFSVNQLALYSGVSAAHISRLERGLRPAPTPDVIKKLAKGLGVPYEYLMKAAGYLPTQNGDDGYSQPWWEKDEPPTDVELMEFIEKQANLRLMGNPLDEEAKEDILLFMRAAYEHIKREREAKKKRAAEAAQKDKKSDQSR